MRNSGVSKIVGIGDIFLETSIGHKLVFKDVRQVPYICLNLYPQADLMMRDSQFLLMKVNGSSPKAL